MVRCIYVVPGSSLLALAAATSAIVPSVSADLPFVFPRPCFVSGILVVPLFNAAAAALPTVQAGISVTVADENQEALVSDGSGFQVATVAGGLAPVAADALALGGMGFRPFPLQRHAPNLGRWVFNVQNRIASIATIAGVYLFTENA